MNISLDLKSSEARLALIAAAVDQLITIDVSARGLIGPLYAAARERQGQPLAFVAAKSLAERVNRGSVVMIATGMLIHPFRTLGETDGPVGGATLGRAVQVGLGAKPLFVTDELLVPLLAATSRAANLNTLPLARIRELDLASAVVGFPTNEAAARQAAIKLVDEFDPKAIIGIERRGPNRRGVYHSVGGKDMSPDEAMTGQLFDECRRRGVLTIGIGDGGNEIGFGVVRSAVEKHVPFGSKCTCPCEGGIADNTQVDMLVAATVSNWGAYGIEACLAAILGRPEVLHDESLELRIIRECADAGGIDGIRCVPELAVDGLSAQIHSAMVCLLGEIIQARAFGHPRLDVHLK